MAFGIGNGGFSTPSYAEILELLFEKWRGEFGKTADLNKGSAARDFLSSVAITISDKGLDNEDIDALWPTLLDLFYAAYPATATGIPLNYVLGYRNLKRQTPSKATGVCTFTGIADLTVPLGTVVATDAGTEFVTTREADIRSRGYVDLPCEAREEGGDGNVVAGAITTIVSSGGLSGTTVRNDDDEKSKPIGHVQNEWQTVSNDGGYGTYQTIAVEDLHHPISLNEISVTVKNSTGSQKFYAINLAVIEDATGDLKKNTEILDLTLASGEEREVAFVGEDFDISQLTTIRLAFVNLEFSEGDIDLAIDTTEGYSGGSLVVNGTPYPTKDITMAVASRTVGAFTGGTDQETDDDARNRFYEGLSMGGSARVAAIRSELMKVNGIRSVEVQENETDHDLTGQGGLPPHSIRVIAYGGSSQDVADAIYQSRSAGVYTYGDRTITVTDDEGQVHTIRFSRPTQVPIYVKINDFKVNPALYPSDGATQIKDAIVETIGGVDSDGVFHTGFGVSEEVSHLKVAGAVESVSGVKAAEVLLGTSDPAGTEDDLTIQRHEVAVAAVDRIEIGSTS